MNCASNASFCFTEEAEASTISMTDFNVTYTKLLKINATLDTTALKDEKSLSVYALVDGGATHSFLSPGLFNPNQQFNICNDRANTRQKFVIHGATGTAKSDCLVVEAKIQIGSWSGYHEFVIASSVKKHDAIIGRDFLKKHKVLIDHNSDSITIEGNSVPDNFKPNSSVNNCLVEDTIVVEPNSQRLIKCVRNNFQLPTLDPIASKVLMFEPSNSPSENILLARSIHRASDENIFCNVLNATDIAITLSKDQLVGTVCIAEIDEEEKQLADSAIPDFDPKLDLDSLNINKDLPKDKISRLKSLIEKHRSLFLWSKSTTSKVHNVKHFIPTGNHPPIQKRQYPIPTIAQQALRDQVKDMLECGFIRPSNSPWRNPVVLVRKKAEDGSIKYRFCLDLTAVNAITSKDSYSLPRISAVSNCLWGSEYYTTMDGDRAFMQVDVNEEDKPKTAFPIDHELYEFNVMPFGSMNAPATFQRLMDRVLAGLTWRQCLVYIDDILVFSKTFEEHLKNLDEIFQRLEKANIKLKAEKCRFGFFNANYLGFNFDKNGVRPTNEKIKAIIQTPPPSTPKKLYGFLCSVNYYRHLIPHFGDVTLELYAMCESKQKFVWSDRTLSLFNLLKKRLTSAPILSYPNFSIDFEIHADASDRAIGSVLIQNFNGVNKPISFASRKLSKTERRYTVTEKELLSLVFATSQFTSYIYGRKIIAYTDHKPLVTKQNLKMPHGRLGRLFLKLHSDADITLAYKPGKENFLPDFLSRSFDEESETNAELNYIDIFPPLDWLAEQAKDPEIVAVSHLIRTNNQKRSDWLKVPHGGRWFLEKRKLFLEDNLLKHASNLIVVPSQLKITLLELSHDSKLAGHKAFTTTLQAVRKNFYWNYLPRETEDFCKSCQKCQFFNFPNKINKAFLQPILASRPWEIVGCDIMGPFRRSSQGNSYIIAAIDHFTKYSEAAPIPTFDALTTAKFIFNRLICRYGLMEKLLTDQGVNFESELIKNLCNLLGVHKLRTTTYHPQGDGISERLIKTLKPTIAKYVNDEHDDWDSFVSLAVSTYNNSPHATTKISPYEALFGRKPTLISDIVTKNNKEIPIPKNLPEYLRSLKENSARIQSTIKSNTQLAQAKQSNSIRQISQ